MKEGSFDKKLLGQSCSHLHMTVLIKLLKNKCPGTRGCWCTDGPCLTLLESLQQHEEKKCLESEALCSETTRAPGLSQRYSIGWKVRVVIVAGADAMKTRKIRGGIERW